MKERLSSKVFFLKIMLFFATTNFFILKSNSDKSIQNIWDISAQFRQNHLEFLQVANYEYNFLSR